jgi:heterodisulfide reductase subunit D
MNEKPYVLKDYREDVQRCMYCGLCRNLCSTSNPTDWESSSPRGRVQLIKALLDGEIQANSYIADRIFGCALCGYCLWRCPSGVRTTDAIKAARAALIENGSYPKGLDRLEADLVKNHNPFGLSDLSRVDWVKLIGAKNSVPLRDQAEYIYFPGCITAMTKAGMKVAAATTSILNSAHLDWTILGSEEWCCGSPLILSGKVTFAKDFADHNVKAVRNAKAATLVTNCAKCYRTLSQEYPRLVGDLGFKVVHITQLLDNLIADGSLKLKGKLQLRVAYHDPCELGRHMKIYDPPRRVLKAIDGIELKEFPRNRNTSACCGGGGVLRHTNPEIALKLGIKRLTEIMNSGVEAIVSACPTCEINLSDAAAKAQPGLRVLDIAEVVADVLN